MKLIDLFRIHVSAALALILTCLRMNAQISGAGTTGVTEGSGRGIGSGGVVAGTGPDTRPVYAEQRGGGSAQISTSTPNTAPNQNVSTAKPSENTRKHTRKSSRNLRSSPAASPGASPR